MPQHLKTGISAAGATTHDAAVDVTVEMRLADLAMTAVDLRSSLFAMVQPSCRGPRFDPQ